MWAVKTVLRNQGEVLGTQMALSLMGCDLGTHNAYRRFRYEITIQSKDFKTMWVPNSQLIRLKVIWIPKTSF